MMTRVIDLQVRVQSTIHVTHLVLPLKGFGEKMKLNDTGRQNTRKAELLTVAEAC